MSSEHLISYSASLVRGSITTEGIDILQQFEPSGAGQNNSGVGAYCLPPVSSSSRSKLRNFISYHEIIWCQWSTRPDAADQSIIDITYIDPRDPKAHVKPEYVSIQVQNPQELLAQTLNNGVTSSEFDICQGILAKAYKSHKVSPSILVIINPHGGQGKAVEIYESQILPVLRAANVTIHYMETKYHQHAIDIAKELDHTRYDIIACCSGDGIPHEVINGFYSRPDKGISAFESIAITQLPCGSGNALTLSTHGSNNAALSTFSMLKAERTKLDLMAVTQKDKPTKLSFLTQCFGIIADADVGTDHLRWMGPIRFDLGVMAKVLSRAKYPCDVYVEYVIDNKGDLESHFNNHATTSNLDPQNASGSPRKASSQESLHQLSLEDFKLSGPLLDVEPPKSWVKLPESVTNNLNIFYVGKMPYISNDTQFFPAALPNDGTMDLVITDTNASIWETTNVLLSIDKGLHVHSEKVIHAKIKSYRLVPRLDPKNHHISVDGEGFPFETMQVELLPRIFTSLLPDGSFVETSFGK